MRTRQRLTAIGAVTLASSAIGGGALVTAHAMESESPPATGTMTVISMKAGDDEAIECTFDDVALPVLTMSTSGDPGAIGVQSGSVQVISSAGSGPVTAAAPEGATLPALPPLEAGTADGPTLVVGSADVDGPTLVTNGDVPEGIPLPVFTAGSENTRPGTDDECAALRPTTTQP